MILSTLFGAINSHAYSDQEVVEGRTYLKFDRSSCLLIDDGAENKCLYEKNGHKIIVSCQSYKLSFALEVEGGYAFCASDSSMTISSNRSIFGMHIKASPVIKSIDSGTAEIDLFRFKDAQSEIKVINFERDSKVKVIEQKVKKDEFGYYDGTSLIGLFVDATPSVENITGIFEQPAQAYKSVLENVLENTLMLNEEIASSHQAGHMSRYIESLRDCIAVLNEKNKYFALDWRVQECSRRVLVFGTVLKEIIADYSHVTKLRPYLESITNLTDSIRKIYGWDRGLAGNVSKATSSLLEVIQLELREILTIKISSGTTNFEIYSKLMKEVGALVSKVNSARNGDATLQRNMWDFVDVWNSEQWQLELKSLLSAVSDDNKIVLSRLQLMFMATESFNDLTKADLEIPLQ